MMFYEKERSPAKSYLLKEEKTNLTYPRHMHSTFEFLYVLEGSLTVSVADNEEYVLTPGKAALLLPYQIHSYRTEQYARHILLIFSSDFVPAFYDRVRGKASSSPVFFFDDLPLLRCLMETDDELLEIGYLYLICAAFYRQNTFTEQTHINVSLLNRIIEYVEGHYTENITLRMIADEYDYSYHYLSNFFNSNIGIHFKRFLNEYRIHHACFLLRDSDCSIADAARMSGYDTLRSFNREFLLITGLTPSDYKRQLHPALPDATGD